MRVGTRSSNPRPPPQAAVCATTRDHGEVYERVRPAPTPSHPDACLCSPATRGVPLLCHGPTALVHDWVTRRARADRLIDGWTDRYVAGWGVPWIYGRTDGLCHQAASSSGRRVLHSFGEKLGACDVKDRACARGRACATCMAGREREAKLVCERGQAFAIGRGRARSTSPEACHVTCSDSCNLLVSRTLRLSQTHLSRDPVSPEQNGADHA